MLLICFFLLQTSIVQNWLVEKYVTQINQSNRSTISLHGVEVNWFDSFSILGLEVLDYQGETMVKAEKLAVDIDVTKLVSKTQFELQEIVIETAELNLTKYKDTLGLNLVEFLNEQTKQNSANAKTKVSRTLSLKKVDLLKCRLRYNNQLKDSLKDLRFDFSHFNWALEMVQLQNLNLFKDSLVLKLNHFTGGDSISNFTIGDLQTQLTVFSKGIYFDSLQLQTKKSFVEGYSHFEFNEIKDLTYFIDKVEIEAKIDSSNIYLPEIEDLIKSNNILKKNIHFSSLINGRVSDLSLKDFKIQLGLSGLKGDFSMTGLPNLEETFAQVEISEGEVFHSDLDEIITNLPPLLGKFERFSFSSSIVGFLNDFVSNSEIRTEYGDLNFDLNLKQPLDLGQATYSGRLGASKLALGSLLEQRNSIGNLSFQSSIKGKGLLISNADFNVKAFAHSLDLFGRPYDSIYFDGNLSDKFLSGNVKVKDPKARLNGDIFVDLNQSPEIVRANVKVDTFNPTRAGITDYPITLSTDLSLNAQGMTLDSLEGSLFVTNLKLRSEKKRLAIDTIEFRLDIESLAKNIYLSLPEMKLNLKGNFEYMRLSEDLKNLFYDLRDKVYSEKSTRKRAVSTEERYKSDLIFRYGDMQEYFKFFDLPIFISKNGVVSSAFQMRSGYNFDFFASFDSVNVYDFSATKLNLDANISKSINQPEILANIIVKSEEQSFKSIPGTNDLFLEATWFNDRMNVALDLEQTSTSSLLDLNGKVDFYNDKIKLVVDNSEVIINNEAWNINPYNSIEFFKGGVKFDRNELYNGREAMLLQGTYSNDSIVNISFDVKDIDLSILKLIVSNNIEGKLTNSYSYRSVGEDSLDIRLTSIFNDVAIDGFNLGDIQGKALYNAEKSELDFNYEISHNSRSSIDFKGYYSFIDSLNALDAEVRFDGTNLKIFSPFVEGVFSEISGQINGKVKVNGTLNSPSLYGTADIIKASSKVDYTNVQYDLNGPIRFYQKKVSFDNVLIMDREQNQGTISGEIGFESSRNLMLNLVIDTEKILVLNTLRTENEAYYGTAYASGNLNILGTTKSLAINAKATTQKGTKIFIPLSSSQQVSTKNYISFVDLQNIEDDQLRINELVNQNSNGVTFDLDLTVTNDAYVELIFDIRTGDIIRGRAEGHLNMSLNSGGDFDLFGGVTITEGAYNFTIPNLINKEFKVEPGSTITWYGDPYAGDLNLEATYRQVASLSDYLNNGETDNGNRLPFFVKLQLDGNMLSPTIDFNISFDNNLSGITIRDEEVLSVLNEDEQELKRQVFSLLILKKFSPQNTFAVGGDAFGSSVSEFLSNQFSYFLSQVDENLEFDFDLNSLDQNSWNTFQLRLSYTFLDGRLKVTGGAQTDIDDTSNQFLGDWSVRYSITENGQLRVRIFSQNEQIVDAWQRETGISIQFIKSFDDLKELISKSKENSRTER